MINRQFLIFVFVSIWISYPFNGLQALESNQHILKSASELDYPPFSIIEKNGSASGFSVELLKAVASASGLEVSFEIGVWSEIKQKLINGQLDVLPLVSYSEERDKVLDFTSPYLRMTGTIFVRKGENSIHKESDLRDKEVLVMKGDTAHEYAIKNKLTEKLFLTETFEQAMNLLAKGEHDAVIVQQLVGEQLIKRLGIKNVVNVGPLKEESLKPIAYPLSGFEQKFCLAVQEGDKELLKRLNEGLTIIITNGTYQELYNTWFGPILPQPSPSLREVIKYILVILIPIIIIIGVVGIFYLRKEISKKTEHLQKEIQDKNTIEAELRASEHTFSQMFMQSSTSTCFYDPKGTIIRVNNEFCKMFGVKEHQILNSNYNLFNDQAIIEAGVIQNIKEVFEKKKTQHWEINFDIAKASESTGTHTSRPEKVYLEIFGYPVLNDKGDLEFVVLKHYDISERKSIEAKLINNENFLDSIIEQSPYPTWISDTRGTMVKTNPSLISLFNLTGKQLIGNYNVFKDNNVDQTVVQKITKVLKNGTTEHFELKWDKKNPHSIRYCDGVIFPIINQSNEITNIVITFKDVTEKKKIELNLKESQKNLLRSQAIAKIGNWEWNIQANKLEWSDEIFRIVGVSPDTFQPGYESYLEHIHDDDRELFKEKIAKAINEKVKYVLEYRIIRPNGDTVFVREHGEPLIDDSGILNILLGTIQDITKQLETLTELEESIQESKILKTAIDQMPVGVALADENLELYFCNAAGLGLRGTDSKELIKIPKEAYGNWQVLRLDGQPYDIADLPLVRTIKERKVIKEDFIVKHEDGTDHICEATAAPIFGKNNKLIGGLIVFPDITEKIRINEQLQQAQKMEAIGNLAGGIAHDFNNILFPIIGMSELLLEDLPKGSPEYENALEVLTAGKRGGELVKQILAFSRISEHKLIPLRIQQVMKEVLKLIRSTIPSNINIKKHIQQDCGLVMADPTQIHQVAMNLITNAYHAVEENEGYIEVELIEKTLDELSVGKLELKSGNYAVLIVSDTGCGIKPEILETIFEPYFTTKEQGKGTGLGLAVVHGIVKEYGGDIHVTSELDKGSVFEVYIPLMKKKADSTQTDEPVEIPTGTEKILVVDDEISVAKLESQILQRLGYQVTSSTSSVEALALVEKDPKKFDLVISDMTMPNLTGDVLAKKITTIRKDMPIIICTGFSEKINKDRGKTIGVNGILMKPVVKSDMARMVRGLLDRQKKQD